MQPVKTKKKLSRADKKQIEAAIARANRTDKKGKSAQDSIPYERMWPDGICRVSDSHYTKTIQFQDINYQLSQNEDKTAIFEGWCDFLNYFDSSIHFQLSFLNLAASEETFANSISIPPQRDAFDSIREEYTTMLQNQLARGNNGLIKTKCIPFFLYCLLPFIGRALSGYTTLFNLIPTILTNVQASVKVPLIYQIGNCVFRQIPLVMVMYTVMAIALLPFIYKSFRRYGNR